MLGGFRRSHQPGIQCGGPHNRETAPLMNRSDRDDPIPRAPFWLGATGLIPFVVLTSSLYALPEANRPVMLYWLTAYAAVILSFVGAIHWGVAMVHERMRDADRGVFMAWSAVPAAAAWVALLLPAKTGLLLLAATFVVHYAADRQFAQRFALPAWYLRLRGGLTAVVVLCLIVALAHVARP
jgi:hypothetical protein